MIHQTILPPEVIFQPDMNEWANQKEIMYDGVPLLVEVKEDHCRILRVNSSDPVHFLDPRFSPGNHIPFI